MARSEPRLYVGNLPYVAQKHDIERLFAENHIPYTNVDISIDPFNGRNPSYCFVDFDSQEHADLAMQRLAGKLVRNNRPVKVNLKTERGAGRSSLGRRIPTRAYDGGWRARNVPSVDENESAYVYDRWSRDDAPSRWIAPTEEGRRLWVGGLRRFPSQASLNAEMRDLFSGFNIEAVSKKILPNNLVRSELVPHSYCFVDLATAEEAQRAIAAIDGKQTPYGGTYVVRKARLHGKPTKVMREQLGVIELKNDRQGGSAVAERAPRKQRNLEGSWRRTG